MANCDYRTIKIVINKDGEIVKTIIPSPYEQYGGKPSIHTDADGIEYAIKTSRHLRWLDVERVGDSIVLKNVYNPSLSDGGAIGGKNVKVKARIITSAKGTISGDAVDIGEVISSAWYNPVSSDYEFKHNGTQKQGAPTLGDLLGMLDSKGKLIVSIDDSEGISDIEKYSTKDNTETVKLLVSDKNYSCEDMQYIADMVKLLGTALIVDFDIDDNSKIVNIIELNGTTGHIHQNNLEEHEDESSTLKAEELFLCLHDTLKIVAEGDNFTINISPCEKYGYTFEDCKLSDRETMLSEVAMLIGLANRGYKISAECEIRTYYGTMTAVTNDGKRYWNFTKNSHRYIEEEDNSVYYGWETMRYEALLIAVIARLGGGVHFDGTTTKDILAHKVMAIASLLSPNSITTNDLDPDWNIEISDGVYNYYTYFASGDFPVSSGMYHWIYTGMYDVDIDVDGEGNRTFIKYKGISNKSEQNYYFLIAEGEIPRRYFHTYKGNFERLSMLSKEQIEGSKIILDEKFAANILYKSNIGEAEYFINLGASSVYFRNDYESIVKYGDDNLDATKLTHDVEANIDKFNSHNTDRSSYDGSLLIVKADLSSNIEPYKRLKAGTVDLTRVSADEAVAMSNEFIESSLIITKSQLLSKFDEFVYAKYSIGADISLSDESIDAVMSAELSKTVGKYFSYSVDHVGKVSVVHKKGISFNDDTPPMKYAYSMRDALQNIKDNVTKGANDIFYSIVKKIQDIDMSNAKNLNAIIKVYYVEGVDHTVDGETHTDTKRKLIVEGFEFSDSAYEWVMCECAKGNGNTRNTVLSLSVGSDLSVTLHDHDMSTVIGNGFSVTVCDKSGNCYGESTFETTLPEEVDMKDMRVEYNIETHSDGTIEVSYVAYDNEENDITDQFMTLTLGDTFIHKELEDA